MCVGKTCQCQYERNSAISENQRLLVRIYVTGRTTLNRKLSMIKSQNLTLLCNTETFIKYLYASSYGLSSGNFWSKFYHSFQTSKRDSFGDWADFFHSRFLVDSVLEIGEEVLLEWQQNFSAVTVKCCWLLRQFRLWLLRGKVQLQHQLVDSVRRLPEELDSYLLRLGKLLKAR